MRHIEIARRYAEELLGQRDDIVAIWVVGSVARGEETPSSDIDFSFMVTGSGEATRAGMDTWRDGLYIEAGIHFRQEYTDLEALLNDPFKATHMRDALILYDPTGFMTQLQETIRPLYMQPQWLGKRLAFWLKQMLDAVARLRDAVPTGDSLRICAAMGWYTFGSTSIPLLRAGVTPSSTRGLQLLGPVDPTFKAQLAHFEGSTQMSADEVVALEPLLRDAIGFFGASFGQLPLYFVPKMIWMAKNGLHHEAVHPMWMYMGAGAATMCLERNIPAEMEACSTLMQQWLQRFHLEGTEAWEAKLQEAETLLQYVERIVEESAAS